MSLNGKFALAEVGAPITAKGMNSYNIGWRGRKEYLLHNAGAHESPPGSIAFDEGQSCLFHFRHKNSEIVGEFITSTPDFNDFRPMDRADVVLYGLWTEDMESAHRIPRHEEFLRYFDPGCTGKLAYVHEYPSGRVQHFTIGRKVETDDQELSELINSLDPDKGPRVVLANSEKAIREIVQTSLGMHLWPIEMEPIVPYE